MWEARTLGVASGARRSTLERDLRQSVPAALLNSRRFSRRGRNIAAGIRIVAGAVTVEAKVMHETDEKGSARSVGEILKALREAEGWTFKQVVRGTNVSERTLRAIEADRLLPSPEFNRRVARMFERHEELVLEYEKAIGKARSERFAP